MSDRTFHYGINQTFTAKQGSGTINLKPGANEILNLPADVHIGGVPFEQTQYLGSVLNETTLQDVDMDEANLGKDYIIRYNPDTNKWNEKQWRYAMNNAVFPFTQVNQFYNDVRLQNYAEEPVKIREVKYMVGGVNLLQTQAHTLHYYGDDGSILDHSGNNTVANVTDGNDTTFFELTDSPNGLVPRTLHITFQDQQPPPQTLEILTTNDATYRPSNLVVSLLTGFYAPSEYYHTETISDTTAGDQTYTLFDGAEFNTTDKQWVGMWRQYLKFSGSSSTYKNVSNLIKPISNFSVSAWTGEGRPSLRCIYVNRLKIEKNDEEEYVYTDFEKNFLAVGKDTQQTNAGASFIVHPDGFSNDLDNLTDNSLSTFVGGYLDESAALNLWTLAEDIIPRRIRVKPQAITNVDYGYKQAYFVDEKFLGFSDVNTTGEQPEQTFDCGFEGTVLEIGVSGIHRIEVYIASDYFTPPFFTVVLQRGYKMYKISVPFAANTTTIIEQIICEAGDYLSVLYDSVARRQFPLNSAEHVFKVESILNFQRTVGHTQDTYNNTLLDSSKLAEIGVPFSGVNEPSTVRIGTDTSTVEIKGVSYPPPISYLSDTTITSPANNEVLFYDSATSKWINKSVGTTTSDLGYSSKETTLESGLDAWTTSTLPTGDWSTPAWSPELGIFASLRFNSAQAMTSSDGISWTSAAVPTSSGWEGAVWCPNLAESTEGQFIVSSSTTGAMMRSFDGITWETSTSTLANATQGAYNPKLGMYIVVGASGEYSWTKDGLNFYEGRFYPEDLGASRVTSIFYGSEHFIAIGNSSSNYRSADGHHWTTFGIPGSTAEVFDVAWSSEANIFVSLSATEPIATLDPDTFTWTTRTTPAGTWYDVIWSKPHGHFLAFDKTAGAIITSPDGITWTTSSSPFPIGSFRGAGIAPELTNQIVFTGSAGNGLYLVPDYSAYRSNLDIGTRNVTETRIHGDTITVGTGANQLNLGPHSSYIDIGPTETTTLKAQDLICNVAASTRIESDQVKIGHSTIEETRRDAISSFSLHNAASTTEWKTVAWSPELNMFASLARTGASSRIQVSNNGHEWVTQTEPVASDWQSITWSPDLSKFVAVGVGTPVLNSSDGLTWTSHTGQSGGWQSVTWSPELGIFCAVSTTSSVQTSTNGTTWTLRTGAESNWWKSVAWSPELGIFCAVARTGTNRVMTSPDGITWTTRSAAAANEWYDVVWSQQLDLFCAVSFTGTNRCMTSPDGITWTTRTIPSSDWVALSWAPQIETFLAVSEYENFATSPDAVNWTLQTIKDEQWGDVTWAPELGIFCAVARTSIVSSTQVATTNPYLKNYNSNVKIGSYSTSDVDIYGQDIEVGTQSGSVNLTGPIVSVNGVRQAVAHCYQRSASGTSGGTPTADAWNTRTLNTIDHFGESFATLSSNTITLPVGEYIVRADAPAYLTAKHILRFRNTSDSTTDLVGSMEWNNSISSTAYSQNHSFLCGILTVSGSSKNFQLQHYTQSANGGAQGLGVNNINTSEDSIFAQVWIERYYKG